MGVPALALAGTALSGVMGAFGAIRQAGAASAQANYQAQVARNNQQIASQNAAYAAQSGAVRAQTQDIENRRILGMIGAAQAASGADINTGSPLAVRQGREQVGRFDTQSAYQTDLLRSIGYTQQAQQYGAEAGLQTAAAGYAQQGGLFGASTSLLGAASSFSEKWAHYQDLYGKNWSPF